MPRQTTHTDAAPKAIGPYAQANWAGDLLYCSGQTAANEKGELQAAGDMGRQLLISWENLETVLEESGYAAKDITRLMVYVTDVDQFMGAYAPLAERMATVGVQTAMTLIGVDRLAFEGQVCEIEATAAR